VASHITYASLDLAPTTMKTHLVLGALLLVVLAAAVQGSEPDPRLMRGGKVLKEGMELDTEQESALPDTSGGFCQDGGRG
jgi:hypothetical protein